MARRDDRHAAPPRGGADPVAAGAPVVAVLGGGQLGRMLGLAGIPLGLGFRFLDPSPGAPAGAVGELVVGALGDAPALRATAAGAAVVTFEWEGVPASAAGALAREADLPLRPGVRPLAASQDRLAEKELFRALGIATPRFAPAATPEGLRAAVEEVGVPAIVKTRRGGYDGKGQWPVSSPADAERAWSELGEGAPLIVEERVAFERELSILAVRGLDGDTRCWPLVENRHADGVLRLSIAPADAPAALTATATRAATALLDELDYVGVLTLELFEREGVLLANEIAPRVHNSGHWTIEGAVTSQFENHLRAILGWPLGRTEAVGCSAMVNCLGVLPERAPVLGVPGAHLHRYGKAERPGRKVGHVTLAAPDRPTLEARLADEAIGALLARPT